MTGDVEIGIVATTNASDTFTTGGKGGVWGKGGVYGGKGEGG